MDTVRFPQIPASVFTEQRYAERPGTHRFDLRSHETVPEWQARLRPVIERMLTQNEMQPCDLAPETLGNAKCDGFTAEYLTYQSEPGVRIPAVLLVPDGVHTASPAILCPPGHGRGLPDQLEPDNDGVRALNYDYSRQFAQRGYVVLTCEVRGFGSLADPELEKKGLTGNCDQLFIRELMLGRVLAGIRAWDLMRGIDYLVSRPEVDPERIGCAGLSMGGELSMLVSALDLRVKTAMISGFLCTYHGLMVERANCSCYTIPGIWKAGDMGDIAGLIAPRPLVVETGRTDGCFPLEAVDEAYDQLERIYEASDASDRLIRDVHPGGHRFNGEVAFDWFDRWL